MSNRAAEELAALTQATQGATARAEASAKAASEAGTQAGAPRRYDRDGDGKASFAFPEALATAVGAGWLLGPIGGIALGIAQGILGQRERQGLLDEFAAEQDAIGGVQEVLAGQFDTLEANATNPNDLEQLGALRQQQDAAFKLMLSGSPVLQQQGMEMLTAVQSEVNQYTDLQETQRIEREALDAQLKRDLDQEHYNRYTKLEDDFTRESQSYEDITGATNIALEALADGTPASLWAASVLVNKALDPTSVVRQEEAQAVGALGSLWDRAGVILERAKNGQSILPEQRRELQALLGTIQNGAKQIQVAREARYLTQLEDSEIPRRYWDNFQLVDSVPAAEARPITGQGALDELGEDAQAILDAERLSVTDGFEAIDNGFTRAMEALDNMGDKAERKWLDIFVPESVTADRPQSAAERRKN